MNKEDLQKRMSEIDKAIEQTRNNFNMLIGNKNEIQYWLNMIDKQSKNDSEKLDDQVKIDINA